MNSQSITNSNGDEFSHYAKSVEKMENGSKFFDFFFKVNLIKVLIYFLSMSANLYEYSVSSISLYLLFLVIETILSVFIPYKDNYIKKSSWKKSLSATIMLIIADIILLIQSGFFQDRISLSFLSLIVMISTAISGTAIKKLFIIKKLSKLKGYPHFSEILDNPNFIFKNQINSNPKFSSINIPPLQNANINYHYNKQTSMSVPSISIPKNNIKPHISVKIPDMKIPELVAVNNNDISYIIPETEKLTIPVASDTPLEARLLGNATIDYKNMRFATAELQILDDNISEKKEKHKKINLSKEGSN